MPFCLQVYSSISTHQTHNKRTKQASFLGYKVNMDKKEPEDFSSSFYFEASGDSEDYPPIMDGYACDDDDDDDDDGDDDALSSNGCGPCNVDELEEDVSCGEEKSGVCGMSYCEDDDEMQEEQMKSYVSFDSSGQDSLDEMEKNRLFWEACLAS